MAIVHLPLQQMCTTDLNEESTGVDGPESRNNVILRGESSGRRLWTLQTWIEVRIRTRATKVGLPTSKPSDRQLLTSVREHLASHCGDVSKLLYQDLNQHASRQVNVSRAMRRKILWTVWIRILCLLRLIVCRTLASQFTKGDDGAGSIKEINFAGGKPYIHYAESNSNITGGKRANQVMGQNRSS
ncbi:hypothetical protein Tco_0572848 [Tanacetum coccineum]